MYNMFYVTTTIPMSKKEEFAINVIQKKLFTPLVSIANSISYHEIEMPNWNDLREVIPNYDIWDQYRNSLEWLIYIHDVWKVNKNAQYLDFIVNIINNWLDMFKTPGKYHSRLIWCDHAVSCRIIVFLTIFDSFNESNLLGLLKHDIKEVIQQHVAFLYEWIKNNHTRTHNHILIACISIVYDILYFEKTDEDNDKLKYCSNIIENYTVSNFDSGINIENSPGYQFHVLVYLTRYLYFITKNFPNSDVLTPKMKETFQESVYYLSVFKRQNKTVPVIGDSNLTLDIFAAFSEEYNNLDMMISYLQEKKIINITETFDGIKYTFISKPTTGYTFMLKNDYQLIIRSNPIIYNWHTHNDQLSINYFRDGIDWITDVGSYPDKRDYCISRIAHNIVLRNMENEDTIKDKYHYEVVNDTHVIITMETSKFVHNREIIWENEHQLCIKDKLKNVNENEQCIFNQIFHVNNNVSVDYENKQLITLNYKNNKLMIKQNNDIYINVYNGSEEPYLGWVCYNASKMENTNTLVYNSPKCNQFEFITYFMYAS